MIVYNMRVIAHSDGPTENFHPNLQLTSVSLRSEFQLII